MDRRTNGPAYSRERKSKSERICRSLLENRHFTSGIMMPAYNFKGIKLGRIDLNALISQSEGRGDPRTMYHA